MAILASAIITSLRSILLDPSPGVTWNDARLLALLNEGERSICLVKPEAYSIAGSLTMVAGTQQAIPSGGTAILDLYENVATKRRAIMANRKQMDLMDPLWAGATAAAEVVFWMADQRDPTRFHVSPPQTGGNQIAALYGITPTPIASTANNINLLDVYEAALKAFVLSQCYAENTDRQDTAKATMYGNEWKQLIGLRTASQVAASPEHQAG